MPIDLANYEKQLKRFGKKFEQFAGKKTSSVLTGSATATASSTTTSSVGDLTRALEHSSRVLSQCEKEPPPPPIQYQSTSPFDVPSFRETASSFDVPTTSSLSSSSFSPASSRQTPIRRSTSTSISTSTSTGRRQTPSKRSSSFQSFSRLNSPQFTRSSANHSSVTHRKVVSRPLHPPPIERCFTQTEDLDGIDVQELQMQDYESAMQMKHVETQQNEELLQTRTKELRNCRQEILTLRSAMDSAHVDCKILRDQLKQALNMNRQMRQQLAQYEQAATQKALASVSGPMFSWKQNLVQQIDVKIEKE